MVISEEQRVRHETLKFRLRLAQSSFADIARKLKVSPVTVQAVAQGRGRSARIEEKICEVIGCSHPAEIWPEYYPDHAGGPS